MTWHVCTVASRKEASAVHDLEKLEIDAYCPMQARWQRIGNHRRRLTSPMVPGYVFVQIETPQQMAQVEAVDGLIDFLRIWRQRGGEFVNIPAEVEDSGWIWETRAREKAGDFDLTIDRSPQLAKEAGEAVKIVGGMFKGQLGKLISWGNKKSRVEVAIFGRTGPAEIPSQHLKHPEAA
jgi:transcription antitermination factor NusG